MIYIGDAMSKANMLTDDSLAKLVDELRGRQVSVSSYVLGQERNVQLMAALANHTGGLVQTDIAASMQLRQVGFSRRRFIARCLADGNDAAR